MQDKEFLEGVGTVCESASKLAALALRSPNFADQNVGNAVDFGLLNDISCEQMERLRDYEKTSEKNTSHEQMKARYEMMKERLLNSGDLIHFYDGIRWNDTGELFEEKEPEPVGKYFK